MTTIRITQDVKNTLNKQAKEMFKKRLEAAEVFFMDKAELGKMVLDKWVETCGFAYHWENIPAEHLCQDDRVCVKALNNWSVREYLPLDSSRPQPRSVTAYSGYDYGYDLTHPDFEPIVEQWARWRDHLAKTKAEAAAFAAKVDTFVSRHSTLRSALGEWPQLWDLVPEDMRVKHNEVTERKAATVRVAETFDTSDLTGALVKNKMVNSIIS